MAGIFTRTLTGAAVAVLAGGAAAVGVTTVASAHTPEVSATCTQLQVHLANYPAKSTVDVVLDGQDEGTDTFGPSTYERTFPLDGTVAHEWSVTLVSGDGNKQFDRTITGKSDGSCLASTPPSTTPPATTPATPPVTTPPATTPPTTPPATTTPTTPPVTTPPATTTPTPTDTPSTPATPIATTVPVPPPSDTPTAGTPTPGTPGTNTPGATTVPVPSPSGSSTPAVVTGPNGGTGSGGTGSATTGTTSSGSTASGDQLAYTGSTVGLGVGVGALTTILVGGALTAIAAVRRRRQARV